ncbi:MAG: carbon-nitrogen hydrolase family protein [Armatimonadota bacterium]
MNRWKCIAVCAAVVVVTVASGRADIMEDSIVQNGRFTQVEDGTPVAWEAFAARDNTAPTAEVSHGRLKLSCERRPCYGGLQQDIEGVEGGQTYQISYRYRTEGISHPREFVHCLVRWFDEEGGLIEVQLLGASGTGEGWTEISDRRVAPEEAVTARIELILKWTTGTVWFDNVAMRPADPVEHRIVNLATICLVTRDSTPDENRRAWAQKCAEAGQMGADIVCCGEVLTAPGTGMSKFELKEPADGPTAQTLGEVADEYDMYIVAGIYEWDGQSIYNTAILLDRDGNLAGRYRKVHLTVTAGPGGSSPGPEYPVFETDFGTIGMEICYDNFFPECARALAVNGAEIIFLPIWGDTRTPWSYEISCRSRALDNSVFLVSSIYSLKRSLIVSPLGEILADTEGEEGVIMAEVDLDDRYLHRGLSVGADGEWETLWPNERHPSTYDDLAEPR